MLALKVKYLGVLMMPVAWAGFILDFVARDALVTRRVVGAMGAMAAGLLMLAWTDPSHHLFWGDLHLEGQGSAAVLVGRGPGFWINITLTYASLIAGIAILVSQAVQSPYLYRKRATILILATLLPWIGNVLFLAGDELPGRWTRRRSFSRAPRCLRPSRCFGTACWTRSRRCATRASRSSATRWSSSTRGDASPTSIAPRPRCSGEAARPRPASSSTSCCQALASFDDQPRRVDLPRPTRSGERVFDASITPIRTRDDGLTGYVVLLRDVTERRQLEEQLRQAQKMEAVGKLAGGVAHDFNNLLTAIIGFASLASDDLPAGSPVQGSLAQIRRSAEQAASLTRQLLAFGRRQILQPEVLDLGEVIAHVLPDAAAAHRRGHHGHHRARPEVPTIRADRTQVQQVLLNLAVNARDAMPRGGLLTIRTSLTTVEARTNSGPDVAPGQYVVLEVADTGQGVDAGDGRPHLRAVFHHQGVRPRHRPWPVDRLRHRQAERRRRAGALHARPGRDVSRVPARRARREEAPAEPEPAPAPGHAVAGRAAGRR